MATRKNTDGDRFVRKIREILMRQYAFLHPEAQIEVKRYNTVSVRVRIIDPDFAGLSKAERDSAIWAVLESLPEDTRAEISLLLLLTPQEARSSLMNLEFEDPTPTWI